MSYPDPFEDKSPWDVPSHQTTTAKKETAPMPETSRHLARFKIGFTLKAGSGYDAEWLTPTVYGDTAEDTARAGAALLNALKAEGLIDLTAKAADYTRSQFKGGAGGTGPKTFQNGKVVPKTPPAVAGDDCPHGRSLVEKANWAAMFCNGPEGGKCEPLWRQKDGGFKAK
ncbi:MULTISPECIES: hypothetical protein [Streptomycetaceae]|uniref:Uncharacterized protein n=1 Tax=Streptantibioticus cattleyicolor (strain ATCC 35852 / DSM 46488 / JCM 4925 / NBRC 14057 / NRRL 8057) TaxID=1003195 RepID=F8JPW4_STREN|nr:MULTISPECIES: hypothetical protein [Streptomycetaceae]AEW94017.1 hypothetical protein SCATT_16460 [Streptantibioticus cattleyicolor NRRL 8057 = DSM 46488]MYS58689.1 hypothetical protein [Streptomyces sp. SID5468]CCB74366.1 protein of unknown function [Streptantibioticus cattleyicolor NRRL 8057 = DSM 46488]